MFLEFLLEGVEVMKRLVVITVGKTHSGKTTFARALNILKHKLSKLIVDYAKENTNFHFIICNSNRSCKGRRYLLEELFTTNKFIRILVHFDISDAVLQERVVQSQRSTNIFRGGYSNFEELLISQQAESIKEDVADPIIGEADHLFVIRDSKEVNSVIQKIVHMADSH